MAESARKFATCVRKYLMLYLRLCELTNDWEALEKALHFLRTDKKVGVIRFERRERKKRATHSQDLDGNILGKCIEKLRTSCVWTRRWARIFLMEEEEECIGTMI